MCRDVVAIHLPNVTRTMNMNRLTPALLALLLATGCASSDDRTRSTQAAPPPAASKNAEWAVTSMTVGDLLAKGGRQLNAAQVKKLLTGSVMEGAVGTTDLREMSFPDGKVTGQSKQIDGHVIDYEGSWWIDEQGRRCWANERQRNPDPSCSYFYLLGDRVYASESDSSRKSGRLEGRRITSAAASGAPASRP